MPLIGGTTADDVKTGRVARLNDASFPARTTLMKLATVSTLWDYIRRAMPWNAPKGLSVDEVYAVTAVMLNLGNVVADDFVLSEQTMALAQARMPNRNGMTTDHAFWPGKGFSSRRAVAPDVKASACMTNCAAEPQLSSFLPEHARMNHGNLAEQVRAVGAQHGVDTRQAAGTAPAAPAVSPAPTAQTNGDNAAVMGLLNQHACVACHAIERKVVGPAFRDVARKHGARADAQAYLAGKIKSGGSGVWGTVPMPPQTLGDDDARMIARWLADGARK
ncbi:MAG: cytochrome C [Burkholderiales bacterium]|nr:cytochrome C [Burkholderiales bacterium]